MQPEQWHSDPTSPLTSCHSYLMECLSWTTGSPGLLDVFCTFVAPFFMSYPLRVRLPEEIPRPTFQSPDDQDLWIDVMAELVMIETVTSQGPGGVPRRWARAKHAVDGLLQTGFTYPQTAGGLSSSSTSPSSTKRAPQPYGMMALRLIYWRTKALTSTKLTLNHTTLSTVLPAIFPAAVFTSPIYIHQRPLRPYR